MASPTLPANLSEIENINNVDMLKKLLRKSMKRPVVEPPIDQAISDKRKKMEAAEGALELGKSIAFRFLTSHKRPATYINGHVYHEDVRSGGRYRYHYCQERPSCSVRIPSQIGKQIPQFPDNWAGGAYRFDFNMDLDVKHNHEVPLTKSDVKSALAEIKCKSLQLPQVSAGIHYDEIVATLSEEAKANIMPRIMVTSNCNKAKRKKMGLPPAKELSDVMEVLMKWTDEDQVVSPSIDRALDLLDDFCVHYNFKVTENLSRGFVIFCDQNGFTRLLEAKRWFCDGTFEVVPTYFGQLWTIHTLENEVGQPALFVLSTHKDAETYESIFEVIFNRFLEMHEVPDLEQVTSDFESGLLPVLRDLKVQIIGCYFHYANALRSWIDKAGLKTAYEAPDPIIEGIRNPNPIRHCIRKFKYLAFLPVGLIRPTANYLLENLIPSKLQNNHFGAYFQNTWLSLFPPEEWCINKEKVRTNNLVEGFHNGLNTTMRPNMQMWDMVKEMKKKASKVRVEISQQLTGSKDKIRKKKSRRDIDRENALLQRQLQLDQELERAKTLSVKVKLSLKCIEDLIVINS